MKSELETLRQLVEYSIKEIKKPTTSFRAKGRIAALLCDIRDEITRVEHEVGAEA